MIKQFLIAPSKQQRESVTRQPILSGRTTTRFTLTSWRQSDLSYNTHASTTPSLLLPLFTCLLSILFFMSYAAPGGVLVPITDAQ